MAGCGRISDKMKNRKFVLPRKHALAGVILALAFGCIEAGAEELPNPFFAMDTGTQDATHKAPAEQVALVKEVGFAGVGPIYHNAAELQQWLVAIDQRQRKMLTLYLQLRLDDVPASRPSRLEPAAALRGRDTLLWLSVTEKRATPLDPQDDAFAVQSLREISG